MPPTWDLACNPGICSDWESNLGPFGLQDGTQSTEPHQPGSYNALLKKLLYHYFTIFKNILINISMYILYFLCTLKNILRRIHGNHHCQGFMPPKDWDPLLNSGWRPAKRWSCSLVYIQQTPVVFCGFTWRDVDPGVMTMKRTKCLPSWGWYCSVCISMGVAGEWEGNQKAALFLSHFRFVLCVSLKSISSSLLPLPLFCLSGCHPSPR